MVFGGHIARLGSVYVSYGVRGLWNRHSDLGMMPSILT